MATRKVFIDDRELIADKEAGTGYIVLELTDKGDGIDVHGVSEASLHMMEAAIKSIQIQLDEEIAKRSPDFTEFMKQQMKTDPMMQMLASIVGEDELMEMVQEVNDEVMPRINAGEDLIGGLTGDLEVDASELGLTMDMIKKLGGIQ